MSTAQLIVSFFKSENAECSRSFALLRCPQVRVSRDSAWVKSYWVHFPRHKSNGNTVNWLRILSRWRLFFKMLLLV